MDNRQIRNVTDLDEFKHRIEKKYDQKIDSRYSHQGYTILVLQNGDEIRVDEDKKLIGNPFGRKGARGAHFTKTKYSEFGIKKSGTPSFEFNYVSPMGAGMLARAKAISALIPAKLVAKEPWQMTREEFVNAKLPSYEWFKEFGWPEGYEYNKSLEYRRATGHAGILVSAFHQHKPIPSNVLMDYPDLLVGRWRAEQPEQPYYVGKKPKTKRAKVRKASNRLQPDTSLRAIKR